MSLEPINSELLHAGSYKDALGRFCNIGHIKNSKHVFECGSTVDGESQVNCFINYDGTSSFVSNDLSSTFLSLNDVPHNYLDSKNKIITVRDDESGLYFSNNLDINNLHVKNIDTDEKINVNSISVKNKSILNMVEIGGNIWEYGNSVNIFKSPCNFQNINSKDINCDNIILNNNISIGKDLISKNINTDELKSKELFVDGISTLNQIYGTLLQCDVIECKDSIKCNRFEIKNDLSVNGNSFLKNLTTNTISNNSKINTVELISSYGKIDNLDVENLTVNNIFSPYNLSFGLKDKPLKYERNDIIEINNLKSYGYAFSPIQINDSIILKLKDIDISRNKINVNFQYYNLRLHPIPSTYKIGELIYQDNNDVICVLKFNKEIPTYPFWLIYIDINKLF
jgi:hypothetical protein